MLYGREELARLTWFCLSHDSADQVVAFTVRESELGDAGDNLCGLPLVPFENLEKSHPPEDYHLLVAIGPHQVNAPRAARFEEGRAKGYRFAAYLSSRARVWPDLEIGAGCMIFEGATVEAFSHVGDNTILRSNCHVSHDGSVGNHVFLAPRSVMSGKCRVGDHSFLGVNSTLRDCVRVAPRCVVGAGAVVSASTEPDGLYVGVPARRSGPAGSVKVWP